jgi:hypothetical protein
MTTNKDFENIVTVLRDHLHLSKEEVEGYLEGSVDSETARLIEEHLQRCHHCAREVDLIREIVSEPEPEAEGLFDRLGIRKVVSLKHGRKKQYDRFWVGDGDYPLTPMKEYPDLLEVEGLYLPELLKLRRGDRNDPGSVPVAVEAEERQPILGSLSDFEAAGDFTDPVEDKQEKVAKVAEMGLRFFAPILHDVSPAAARRQLKALPGKWKRRMRPKPRLILKYNCKLNGLEIFYDEESGEVFLKVQARKDGKK